DAPDFCFYYYGAHRVLHSFPTRRSSDLTLFASFVCPHPPFIAPPEFQALYDPEAIALPVNWRQEEWVHHPAFELRRRIMCCEERSEEHTSELQSRSDLVCRLLLEKKNIL